MKYICSATIKVLPQHSHEWLAFLSGILNFNAEQQACINETAIFKGEGHIEASCFFRTAFDALYKLRSSDLLGIPINDEYLIKDISVRFTRYENTVFLFFLVETDAVPETEQQLTDQQNKLLILLNTEFGECINFDFHVTAKVEQYEELLRYQPITPVYDVGESVSEKLLSSYVNQHPGEGYCRYYKTAYSTKIARDYTGNGESSYVREQRSILCLSTPLEQLSDGKDPTNDKQRSQFYNIIQTEAAFFSRTKALELSLASTYDQIDFLSNLVDIMQSQWVKIRSLFSISPKFSLVNRSHTSHLFFNLLEVNAQVTALESKIATRLDKEFGPMQERYERLHFNASNALVEEQAYFKGIHEQVLKSFSAYVERMEVVSRSIERLDKGISQLREDFDSNTNVIVQMLMFLFSVVMVFWGLVVFLADKGMGVIPYKLTFPVLTMVGVAALAFVFGGYMLIARMYANRSAKVMENTVHEGIERCLIDCPNTSSIIEKMVQRYITDTGPKRRIGAWHRFKIRNNNPAKQSVAYLFKMTQCLELFSTLLPAIALERYSNKKAVEALNSINDKLTN